MKILRTVKELENIAETHKNEGKTVGLVPTMGALHEGHISLVKKSKADNDITIVSIFVNPTQFNNANDLATYPRTEEEDIRKLVEQGVDYVFIPAVHEVYPEPDKRIFPLGHVAEVMEGAMRPGHFNGVAQIVSKLFAWSQPTKAYFGEKDFQQIAVIKQMMRLENFNFQIVECPIVREEDGLAKSSRNVRLSPQARSIAPRIHEVLEQSKQWKEQGATPAQITEKVTALLNKEPLLKTEYYEIVNSQTLSTINNWNEAYMPEGAYPIGCIAIFCDDVRLIDNIKYN